MANIQYRNKGFQQKSLGLVEKCNEILQEYEQGGYSITLRQLYYQLVSRNIILNNEKSYKNIGNIVSDARYAGLIDWNIIEDRTRKLQTLPHWDTPSDIIKSCVHSYRLDKWEFQDVYPEVWVEKDALVGIIERPCKAWDVPYFSCRGYTSSSEMHKAAFDRFVDKIRQGKKVIILHLGDHDPAGLDMTRDITDRIREFISGNIGSTYANAFFKVQRLALNMDQVRRFNLPENYAKVSDTKVAAYIAEYGIHSWELDALQPDFIAELIEDSIRELCDTDEFNACQAAEEEQRELLTKVSNQWDKITSLFN
jgi:hypothetical protein